MIGRQGAEGVERAAERLFGGGLEDVQAGWGGHAVLDRPAGPPGEGAIEVRDEKRLWRSGPLVQPASRSLKPPSPPPLASFLSLIRRADGWDTWKHPFCPSPRPFVVFDVRYGLTHFVRFTRVQ